MKRFTYGVCFAKMQTDIVSSPEWDTPWDPELIPILKQPFFFLGKGSQCYAFESEDKNYVIKIFRYDYRGEKKKTSLLFQGAKIAFSDLKEETALVYLHLNPTELGLPKLVCKGPLFKRFLFDLDHCRFALQKKVSPFKTLLESRKIPEEMREKIDSFFALLIQRAAKDIRNTDPNIDRNFGFLENRAVEIDFGNYRKDLEGEQKKEIDRFAEKLQLWLHKNIPEWEGYCRERRKTLL